MKNGLVAIIILLCSCCDSSHNLEETLELAGNNRPELEKVLKHYSVNPSDSLKYKAACFLIENMNVHLSQPSAELHQYFQDVNSTFRLYKSKTQFQPAYDSLTYAIQNKLSGKEKEYDCRLINADYLILTIDDAFSLWKLPWAKHLSFEDFCEYLLPYKINGDVIDNWRDLYSNRLITTDSLLSQYGLCSMETICEKLSDSIYSVYGDNAASFPLKIPFTYPSALIDMEKGTCTQQSQLSCYYMRSLGIPVCIDLVPQWGNRSNGHSWNILKTANKYPANFAFSKLGHLEKVVLSEKATKIYRRTYARNKNSLAYLSLKENEDIPPLFRDPCLLDVTAEYATFIPTSDITIELSKSHPSKCYAYIAAFDNREWKPVDWGRIKNNKVTFNQIGNCVVYIVLIYEQDTFIPISLPFILTEDSQVIYLKADTSKKQSMSLIRKYYPTRSIAHAKRMLHGQFQASNYPDFKDAVDLYSIEQIPDLAYTSVQLSRSEKFRYIRYIGADSMHCNIAEMEVYTLASDSMKKLTGKIIGTKGAFRENEERTKEAVLDGDPLTFFDAPENSNGWVGLDLLKPQNIDKIRFLPRNDDNNIRIGDEYELVYWENNGQWVSLGKKIANDATLIFENVPSNTLYLLHNLSRGKEERIFTYENGKQVWW